MFKINLIKVVLFIILAFFSTSCDNSSTGAEEHVDADGFSMELNDVEVYRELEGEIITNTINLSINDTLDLSVHFLDHEGNEIHHHDEEGEEELTFNIQDYNIINIISNSHHDDHEFGLLLIGTSTGTTTFTMSLMHDGHADYTSLPISVTVD